MISNINNFNINISNKKIFKINDAMINTINIKTLNISFFNICNVVATWPCHVISLVITLNNIPLSPPIALTYHFVPDGSPFRCTKPHSSICWELTLLHHIAETLPAVIPTVILLSSHLLGMRLSLIGSRWGSRSPLKALRLRADDWVIL